MRDVSFNIDTVTCDIPDVIATVSEITKSRKSIQFQLPPGLKAQTGTVRLVVHDESGASHEEILSCTVSGLMASPEPVEVE